MISMPSESWLNLLCKHRRSGPRYPDMILIQLTLFSCSNTWPEVIGTYFIDHGNK